MRIALFGGTFDPPHIGHLLMAEAAQAQFHLDRVVFLPTGQPPHKSVVTSARHRLAMTRAAVRGYPHFSVSAWEAAQKRTVYTYETLAHFKSLWPRAQVHFILGSDSLAQIDRWRQGRTLLKQARFLVVDRLEHRWSALPARVRAQTAHVDMPPVAIASHTLRKAIRQKQSVRYQVPAAVDRYIHQHHIYQ